jgi:hypothetical protein
MKKVLIAVAVFIAQLAQGDVTSPPADQAPPTYEAFSKLPYSARRTLIAELPVELRVRAYFDMVSEFKPPDFDLAAVVAPAGDELVPVVWRTLQHENNDLRFLYGLVLLSEIDKGGYARIGAYPSLMEFLRERTSRVEPPAVRDECEYVLGGIRR